MIRFICREVNCGAAVNVGGPVDTTLVTFTDAAALESWLRFEGAKYRDYLSRECIGVEVPDNDSATPEKP